MFGHLGIESGEVPVKCDLRAWYRMFAVLRNKTRGHGATLPGRAGAAAVHLDKSLALIIDNCALLKLPWAHLYRTLSGKYRASAVTEESGVFEYLRTSADHMLPNGIYLWLESPRQVPLIDADPELQDFYISNGGYRGSRFEMISYYSDDRRFGDASVYLQRANPRAKATYRSAVNAGRTSRRLVKITWVGPDWKVS
jgi:hypothetical protein